MAKDPSFPLYAQDFLIDVIQLPDELVGAYIRLLCVMWINGFCYDSAIELAMISPLAKKVIERIPDKFTFHQNGTVTNNRLEKERTKRIKNRELRRIAGKKGAKIRWQTDSKDDGKDDGKKMAKEEDNDKEDESIVVNDSKSEEIKELVTAFYDIQYSKFPKQLKEYKNNKEKLVNDSINEIDKIMRIDGYTMLEIHRSLEFAVKDDFWFDKILSLRGLRKKSSKNDMSKFANIFTDSKTKVSKSQRTMETVKEWAEGREYEIN